MKMYGPIHDILALKSVSQASSEGSDKPVYPHSLVRAFATLSHHSFFKKDQLN